ncbi:hypothetical protein JD844_001485 [Phrynosoma platyrhinos]|uniref:Voltage-dependent calcium channel gamma-4 subunit n=1 Tax=Phrynosoma platyrhinos TaxID=52577 RepID=A0ABQ7TAI4_PHRPL|nr:hypothetical protein JD844_001485 [Phrynosoma platyrhinos]
MVWCEKGVQILLTTVGAFAAFGLMIIAIGTDYWLYARLKRGVCVKINHFPEDTDYDHDSAEYLLRLSNIIGVIVYISANTGDPGTRRDDEKKSHYSYGWSFYFGGLSFILAEMIGVLAVNIYIEKNREAHCKSRTELLKNPSSSSSAILRLPSYRFRYRRRSRSSSRSTEPSQSRETSPVGLKGFPSTDISMYTLSRDPSKANVSSLYGGASETASTGATAATSSGATGTGGGGGGGGGGFLQLHNTFPKDPGVTVTVTGPSVAGATGTLGKDASSNTNTLNRKTTPV